MTRNDITVREAEIRDIPVIAGIEKECSSEPWTEEQLSEELGQDFAHTLVAEAAGEVLGFGNMHVVCDDAHINELGVDKKHRRTGAASAIIEKMLGICSEKQCFQISLEVREGNAPAISLYRKYGFTSAGIRKRFYRDPAEDAITMIRRFEES